MNEAMMTRKEAVASVAQDVLRDPVITANVVVAAILAQDLIDQDNPAWDLLQNALLPAIMHKKEGI